DAKQWRESDVLDEIFEIERTYRTHLSYVDQDIFNKVFSERGYKILDPKYNNFSLDCSIKPIIKHFVGGQKPLSAHNYSEKYIQEKKKASRCLDYFWLYAEESPFHKTMTRILSLNVSGKNDYHISEILNRLSLTSRKILNIQTQRNQTDGVFAITIFITAVLFLAYTVLKKDIN
ncbi:MAG: hypothetical protein LBG48_04930, partial [Rickettsiales bacterium]|nr:hypothetical protein [Rickettsiales bacterium]